MPEISQVSDSGIVSLSGFAYQIKVFMLLMSQLSKGQQVEFETLDDVAVRDIPADDKIEDFCLKRKLDDNSTLKVFQVKQTAITPEISRKILYNWLLALNTDRDISSFLLYVEKVYYVKMASLSGKWSDEYNHVISSDKSATALVTRIKHLYQNDKTKFEADCEHIYRNHEIEELEIDKALLESLEDIFHSSANVVGPIYFQKRIDELFTRICARIIESASKRKAYICTKAEYMQVCEEICKNISSGQYTPDYTSFKKLHAPTELSEGIVSSREYKQLTSCNLQSSDIINHLGWEQYYQNIRQHYLSDAQKERIEDTEDIAFQNHRDVVLGLQAENKDQPLLRLIKTKACPISTLKDEHSRWGSYVFLTNDLAEKQISWKDEVDEND